MRDLVRSMVILCSRPLAPYAPVSFSIRIPSHEAFVSHLGASLSFRSDCLVWLYSVSLFIVVCYSLLCACVSCYCVQGFSRRYREDQMFAFNEEDDDLSDEEASEIASQVRSRSRALHFRRPARTCYLRVALARSLAPPSLLPSSSPPPPPPPPFTHIRDRSFVARIYPPTVARLHYRLSYIIPPLSTNTRTPTRYPRAHFMPCAYTCAGGWVLVL